MTLIPDTDTFEAARKAHFAVTLHNPADFEGMRRAGRLAAEALDLLVPLVKPGVTTAELDKVAYVRFASVYLEFEDVSEFMTELKTLVRARAGRT